MMVQVGRYYSLREIDEMREALRNWCGADRYFPGRVEKILHTYMLNGTPPDEVIKHANEQESAAWKRREGWLAERMADSERRP